MKNYISTHPTLMTLIHFHFLSTWWTNQLHNLFDAANILKRFQLKEKCSYTANLGNTVAKTLFYTFIENFLSLSICITLGFFRKLIVLVGNVSLYFKRNMNVLTEQIATLHTQLYYKNFIKQKLHPWMSLTFHKQILCNKAIHIRRKYLSV